MEKDIVFGPTYGWRFMEAVDGTWRAAQAEYASELTNNYSSVHVIRAKDVKTIKQLLTKHEGLSAEEINKLY